MPPSPARGDRAGLVAALHTLAVAADHAVAAGRVASALAPCVEGQLTKAMHTAAVTPTDPTTLLVHLTVARSVLVEGWGPPAPTQALGAAIARVHHLARTAPAVFRAGGDIAGADEEPSTPRLGRLLP